MKLLLTFFILICFDLLGAQSPVVPGTHDFNSYPPSGIHLSKTKAVAGERFFLTNPPDTPADNELSAFLEEDDEENNNRKWRSSIESWSTCCYAFITSYPCRDITNRLSVLRNFSHISSCKYIAQRVLRI